MKRKTTEQFITEAKLVHGDRYNYSVVDYINTKTKIKIICPEHGIFEQLPNSHLDGTNCHVCGQKNRSKSRTKTTNKFIEDARKIHGDKYDYTLTEYVGESKKVKIICSKHGIFEQTASGHLKGNICYKCSVENKTSNTEKFISKARKVHGDKYDYSLVNYIGSHKHIKIICQIHGIFEQKPSNHLTGYCCTKCNKAYKLTTEDFIKKSKEIHGDKYDYSLSIC